MKGRKCIGNNWNYDADHYTSSKVALSALRVLEEVLKYNQFLTAAVVRSADTHRCPQDTYTLGIPTMRLIGKVFTVL